MRSLSHVRLLATPWTAAYQAPPSVGFSRQEWGVIAFSKRRRLSTKELMLERTLESPLDHREIKPVNPKENQPWMFIERTGAEAPILWPPDAKSWLTGKDSDAGKDWGQEEKGASEDETVGWNHWLNRHEFEQILGGTEGQGNLACCDPWGHRHLDTT